MRGDLDLVIEANRLGRNAFVEFVDQEVRALALRDVGRKELLAGRRLQVVAHESVAAVGGDPAECVQAVIGDAAVACRHCVGGAHHRQRGQEPRMGDDVSDEPQWSSGTGAHRMQ